MVIRKETASFPFSKTRFKYYKVHKLKSIKSERFLKCQNFRKTWFLKTSMRRIPAVSGYPRNQIREGPDNDPGAAGTWSDNIFRTLSLSLMMRYAWLNSSRQKSADATTKGSMSMWLCLIWNSIGSAKNHFVRFFNREESKKVTFHVNDDNDFTYDVISLKNHDTGQIINLLTTK